MKSSIEKRLRKLEEKAQGPVCHTFSDLVTARARGDKDIRLSKEMAAAFDKIERDRAEGRGYEDYLRTCDEFQCEYPDDRD